MSDKVVPTKSWLAVRLIPAILCACLCCSPTRSVEAGHTADYTSASAALSRFILHEMEDKQLPTLSIALVDNQQIVWSHAFGYVDQERRTPATAETIYRIGSVSKLFTDIGVMQLVEKGELDLDVPVSQYIPDFHPINPFHKEITLRQLMSHRSGLLREPPVGNYFDPSDLSLADMVHSLNATTLIYPPASHTKYSNAGVAVVGYVLEKRSERPFADYLRDAVLEPMGLHNSAFGPDPGLIRNLSKAYMWSYDGRVFAAPTFELGMAPAGCMYSTVLDLGRFLSVLFNGGRALNAQVLEPETLEKMWTPQFATPGEDASFGIGFHLSKLDGRRLVGHGGAIYGFATQLAALPDDKLGAVAVATMDSSNGEVEHIVEAALRMMLAVRQAKPLPELPPTTPIPPQRVRQLEGHYGTGSTAVDLIEQNHDLFLLPAAGGEEARLRQLNGDVLIEDGRMGYGLQVTPERNGIKVGDQLLERMPNQESVPIPDRWKGLIGEYGWDYDTLYIFEKDGKLTALIEWYDYAPLTESSHDVFTFPSAGLYDGERAVFSRDQDGNATQVQVSGVIFKRRPPSSVSGGVFRVTPLKPVSELLREALASKPPNEVGDFRKPDLVDVTSLDPTIKLDIRYSTANNFLGTPVYTEAKAFLQRPAAEALARVERHLKTLGYGLLIHDAYRPWYVTKVFWDATPADKHVFVADPKDGSRHNRGCAVDLTLYDLSSRRPLEMTGVYDEMSERSYPFYPGGTSLEREHRDLLRHVMETEGFEVYPYEWWHFDYKDWRHYSILNLTFEQIEQW